MMITENNYSQKTRLPPSYRKALDHTDTDRLQAYWWHYILEKDMNKLSCKHKIYDKLTWLIEGNTF